MIFGVQSFDVQIRCSVLFDVQYLSALGHSAFGHSMLGPYSALGSIRCSVIRCSVSRCSVFRRSAIRCSVIRRSVFRRSVGESLFPISPRSQNLQATASPLLTPQSEELSRLYPRRKHRVAPLPARSQGLQGSPPPGSVC